MSRTITQNQENDLITTLERPMAMVIIEMLRAWTLGVNAQPNALFLVSNTQPNYVVATDYEEAVEGAIVTYLTVGTVQFL